MNYTGTQAQQFTSKGQGLYNSIVGTIGAADAMFGGNNCGGGLFNLGGNNNGDCYETKEAAALRTRLAIAEANAKTAETSKTDLERFYVTVRNTDEKIADGLIQTGNALGVLTAKVECLEQSVARNREESFRNLQESKSYTDSSVEAEANVRKCEDEKTLVYVNGQLAQKVSYSKRIDRSLLCGSDSCGDYSA